MAQSVTNEALWVKLSEIEQKLDRHLVEQKSTVLTQESAGDKLDFTTVKEEIIAKINNEIGRIGRSSDSHFEANKKNIGAIIETIQKIWNIVSRIRKQQREPTEPKEKEELYLNLWFFKVRKTSFVIASLGLLVLILTLFCMKQQNDYSVLINESYKQGIIVSEIQTEVDNLRNIVNMNVKKRGKTR